MDTRTPIERLIDQACGLTGEQTGSRTILTALPAAPGVYLADIQHTTYFEAIKVSETHIPREVWVLFDRETGADAPPVGFVEWRAEWQAAVFMPEPDSIFSPGYLEDIAQFCRAQGQSRSKAAGAVADAIPLP